MDIEIAKYERMAECGSALLRLIQNNDMPLLDLLVRESVQNSLDAALPGSGHVSIDYKVGEFDSGTLNREFEGISESLDKRFASGMYKCLAIRDSQTVGLTGPMHHKFMNETNSEYGNLIKLVYEISKPQQNEGAGGSWGLGKTVYFRIGIGLVIYYSRVGDDKTGYSSRLAACLVEDERKPDALITKSNGALKRGIAWWGQRVDEDSSMPLTNESEIQRVLDIMGIEPYGQGETGTTIIIPYISEEKLLGDIVPHNDVDDSDWVIDVPWWCSNLDDYIKVAIQKWYAPRLMNKQYSNGRWLKASVNNKPIEIDDMLPLFRIIQALYNRAKDPTGVNSDRIALGECEWHVESVSLRNVFIGKAGSAGFVIYGKFNKEILKMSAPNNCPNPYVQINRFDENSDKHPPIILYTRKPGMIVGYETTGIWTDGIDPISDGDYVFGIFVANSENIVKIDGETLTLESYLRKSEKADHTSWSDINIGNQKPTIVTRIQRGVKKHVKLMCAQQEAKVEVNKKNLGLGKVLAEMLLPPESFGTAPSLPSKGGGGGSVSKRAKGPSIGIEKTSYSDGKMHVEFDLNLGKKHRELELQLEILTETGVIGAEEWESEGAIGLAFPLELDRFEIKKVKTGKQGPPSSPSNFVVGKGSQQASYGEYKMHLVKTKKHSVPYGIKLNLPEQSGGILIGRASFSKRDERVQGGLTLIKDEGDNE